MVITTISNIMQNLVLISSGLCGREHLKVQAAGIWRDNSGHYKPSYHNADE